MKTTTKWMAVGAGVGCVTLVGRALVSNTAGVIAAILSDFEARRTDVPLPVSAHRTTRVQSSKLPPRLKADIEHIRSASGQRTISLVEDPAPLAR